MEALQNCYNMLNLKMFQWISAIVGQLVASAAK